MYYKMLVYSLLGKKKSVKLGIFEPFFAILFVEKKHFYVKKPSIDWSTFRPNVYKFLYDPYVKVYYSPGRCRI